MVVENPFLWMHTQRERFFVPTKQITSLDEFNDLEARACEQALKGRHLVFVLVNLVAQVLRQGPVLK
jgi:hypothetical protein